MIQKMSPSEFEDFILSNADSSLTNEVYPPELDDLFFLYSHVRDTSAVSVLELGGGFSTLALSRAIWENEQSFGEVHRSRVRHPNAFKLLSIDASETFSKVAASRLPAELLSISTFWVSGASLVELTGEPGQICSVYDNFPFFTPDVVYLDGPDSDQVIGSVRGYQVIQPHSVPMGADLLSIEPQLWPGTSVLTDGRMANARFLLRNFKRNWESLTDFFGNRVIMRLAEEPLGEVNMAHMEIRLQAARKLRDKELPLIAEKSS